MGLWGKHVPGARIAGEKALGQGMPGVFGGLGGRLVWLQLQEQGGDWRRRGEGGDGSGSCRALLAAGRTWLLSEMGVMGRLRILPLALSHNLLFCLSVLFQHCSCFIKVLGFLSAPLSEWWQKTRTAEFSFWVQNMEEKAWERKRSPHFSWDDSKPQLPGLLLPLK